MDRIQKVSSYLLVIFNVLLVALPVLALSGWVLIDWAPVKGLIADEILINPIKTPEGVVNLASRSLSPLSKMLGFIGTAIGQLPVFLGLFVLKSVFKNYRRGEIFTYENARHYKHLGWLFFFNGLFAKSISEGVLVVAATLSNPPGHRYLTLSVGTPNLEAIFCGVLVIVISWVMMEGYKLQEDQKFIV